MQVLRFLKVCVTDLVRCLIHGYNLNMEYRDMVDYGSDDDDDNDDDDDAVMWLR
jgi:hypothetical protein